MTGKTHIAVGMAAALLISRAATAPELAATVIGAVLGGVMPDIDVKPRRKGRGGTQPLRRDFRLAEIASALMMAILFTKRLRAWQSLWESVCQHWPYAVAGVILLLAAAILGVLSPHRERTHSLLFLGLFSLAVYGIHPQVGFAFAIAYGSHLLLDLTNAYPLRLLFPLQKKLCLKWFKIGGLADSLFLLAGIAIIAAYFGGFLWPLPI